MQPAERFRESIFALQNMYAIGRITGNSEFAAGAQKISLQQNWYHEIVNSLAWDLDIPFSCCFANKIFEDFPLKRIKNFKKNLQEMRKCSLSNMDDEIEKLTDDDVFALIDNEKLKLIIQLSVKTGNFAEIADPEHFANVMDEIIKNWPEFGEHLIWDSIDYKYQQLVTDVSEVVDQLRTPIKSFVVNCWENHALFLTDAMTTIDFNKSSVRIDDFLAFEDVPRDVSEGYLFSFKKFSDEAKEIRDELQEVNRKIGKYVSKEAEQKDVSLPIQERYIHLEKCLQLFVDTIQSPAGSVLCICDCSPTGFLNDLLPPV